MRRRFFLTIAGTRAATIAADERALNLADAEDKEGKGRTGPTPPPTPIDVPEVEIIDERPSDPLPPAAVIHRGDRFPPNLFVVAAPGVVVFPDLTVPMVLRAPWAERTLAQASSQSDYLGIAVLRAADPAPELPKREHLHTHGCLVRILRSLQMPDGARTVLVQGVRRFKIERYLRTEPYLIAKVSYPEETPARGDEAEALARNVRGLLRQLVEGGSGNPEAAQEMGVAVLNIERKGALADFAATYVIKPQEVRAELLAELDVTRRLRRVAEELTRELQIVKLGNRLQEEIRTKIEKRQHEYFLREQLKAIRKELGEERDERGLELEELRKRMESLTLPPAVKEHAEDDLRRLALLSADSPEAAVLRGYLDWLFSMPFGKETADAQDLVAAQRVLDRDHHGLEEIKDRILEFLAVRSRVPHHKGQILCLLGPPGVGKTSLGRSIAEALGRSFVRVSLGGVRDEAEIRGHRRTYVGAQPGRIVRAMKQAASMNPVFMLDEIDKLGADFRGDPGSALLEALDPEQNSNFSDHYLEVPLDLSKVFFIATANDLDPVPAALRDRLEVIELSGYITEEKLAIASDYLLPRQRTNHGLKPKELRISRPALVAIIEQYTREAGVRSLEKALARICRKVARRLLEAAPPNGSRNGSRDGSRNGRKPGRAGKPAPAAPSQTAVIVDVPDLQKYLGPPRFPRDRLARARPPGVAIGLAWTPVGGEVLEVQAMAIPEARKGFEITGMLGDVMNESARIAVSYVLGHARELGIVRPLGKDDGLHLHVPAGAVRKDGPSAGVTLATALVSLLTDRPVRAEVAMTGEITLTGQVLMVGGIKEKVLAARRAGIKEVLLPADNRRDVEEIRPELTRGLTFRYVQTYRDLLPLAFKSAAAKKA